MPDQTMMTLHTFELSQIITMEEYRHCKDALYAAAKERAVRCFEENGWINFRGFSAVGVHLSMRKNLQYPGAIVRLAVNPSTLLGSDDPTELFLPTEKSMESVVIILQQLLQSICFSAGDIRMFRLSRLDLCKNVQMETQEHLLEYLRLFRKGANRSSWEEITFGDDDLDAHSVRRKRNDYIVTVYDKIFELAQPDRSMHHTAPAQLDGSYQILRIETALLRAGILSQMKARKISRQLLWPDLLTALCRSGLSIMYDLIDILMPGGFFYNLDAAKLIVQMSGFRADKQENLIDFLCGASRYSRLDIPKIKMFKNGKKRMEQLYDLGISPITIESRSKICNLPSIQALVLLP